MCVCCTHPFSFFPLAFVLVNNLFSGFSFVFENAYDFLFVFVAFCCIHLYFMFTAVSYQMFFHVPPLGFLK